MIPLVERMDYLGAQSNSLAYALCVEKLLGLEMPQRVKDIRVLIAELQRLASHLIWLGTHAMEIGAVSMLFYAIRERELLLNINELIAGFRFFPSYIRIGGLREDLPRGFHEAVNAFLERFPAKLDEFEGLLTKNDIFLRRTDRRRRRSRRRTRSRGGWSGRSPAPPAPTTTSGSTSRISATRPTTSRCPTATEGDVFARYRVRIAEMRESVKICKQAIARITPTGAWACDDTRVVPPPKDKVYTEMEALIQHFLIYSQGFTVPAGEAYVPIEGPRGEHGVYVVSDGTNRPWRVKMRAPSFMAIQALPSARPGRPDRRRGRRDRIQRRRHGRLRPVSFHPRMEYAPARFHKSERKLAEPGERVHVHAGEPGEVRRQRHAVSGRPAEVGDSLRALSCAEAAGLPDRRPRWRTWRSRFAARPPRSRTSCRTTRCSSPSRSASTC